MQLVGLITANTLQVDNVQGTFNIGVGTITYNNGSGFVALDGGTTVDTYWKCCYRFII